MQILDQLKRFNSLEPFRYMVTMGLWTAVDYTIVACLLYIGITPVVAVTVAYLIAVRLNLAHQKAYTFQDKSETGMGEIVRYGIAVAICWFLMVFTVFAGTTYLDLHTITAKLISQPFTFISGYLLMRYFVFPKPKIQ